MMHHESIPVGSAEPTTRSVAGDSTPDARDTRLIDDLRQAHARLVLENRQRPEPVVAADSFETIVGNSIAIRRVLEQVRRVVTTRTTVLLEGPTGSGKELIARTIHGEGTRRGETFVAVNCGSMPGDLLASALFGHRRGSFTGAVGEHKGFFELASGGTLFLDEIGEASGTMQVHLLRALQEDEVLPVGAHRPIKVDVRVIAASNRDLEREVREGRFRADLWHRLRVFPIRLPSLAERREDIPALADHLLRRLAPKVGRSVPGFSPDAIAALVRHEYEGNVRELANVIERALVLCPPGAPIAAHDLFERPPGDTAPTTGHGSLRAELDAYALRRILETLRDCGGNKSAAARRLGLTYRGLLMRMKRHGLAPGRPS